MAPRATLLLAVVLVVLVVHAQCKVRPCKKACGKNFDLVCGSNGVTYNNPCEFENARCDIRTLRLQHKGPCQAKTCSKSCPKNIRYVCGTTQILYNISNFLKLDLYTLSSRRPT
uniref:Kazal-type proteinase inhibitor n=1 Tax=Pacifastacus leniusculus TaxID=6720 RepID=C7T5D6_PACLE|nr:Kazal-type proteinase inhibitor [Pacifastacus leniusculus]